MAERVVIGIVRRTRGTHGELVVESQTDLPDQKKSGLRHSLEILKALDEIGFTYFTSQDVVRHPLVKKIVTAYEREDNK